MKEPPGGNSRPAFTMNANSFDLPTAGLVLGALDEALDLHAHAEGKLDDASVRRYFRGERLTLEKRHNVHAAVARALLAANLLPTGVALRDVLNAGRRFSGNDVNDLAGAIDAYATSWDGVVGRLRTSAPIDFPKLANAAALELVSIDVAVRFGALLWLTRSEESIPIWPLELNGPGDFLREKLKEATVTRDGLAFALEVDRNTVDSWLDQSKRPRTKNIARLTAHIAALGHNDCQVTAERLRAELERAYAFRHIAFWMRDSVGAEAAGDIIARIGRYSVQLVGFLKASRLPREQVQFAALATVFFGVGSPEAAPWVDNMLTHLWRNEPDPVWRTSLKAGGRWVQHLSKVASKLGPIGPAERQELAKLFGHAPTSADLERLARCSLADHGELARDPLFDKAIATVRASTDGAATNLRIEGAERAQRDPLGAIEFLRASIERDPLDAESHFRLGARLGVIGDIDASLVELRIAAALRPGWDRPRVEIAIVLLNAGRASEAFDVLVLAQNELAEVTPWVRVHVAFALEQLDRFDEAIAAYETHLEHAPSDGEALDRLAHLLLVRGEKRSGRERAKQAAACGLSTVFDALESGFYGKGVEGSRRPPHRLADSVHFRPFRDRAR